MLVMGPDSLEEACCSCPPRDLFGSAGLSLAAEIRHAKPESLILARELALNPTYSV